MFASSEALLLAHQLRTLMIKTKNIFKIIENMNMNKIKEL